MNEWTQSQTFGIFANPWSNSGEKMFNLKFTGASIQLTGCQRKLFRYLLSFGTLKIQTNMFEKLNALYQNSLDRHLMVLVDL